MSLIDDDELKRIRELACRQTGMTMAQLLEAESKVSHPREHIPETKPHAVLMVDRMRSAGVPALYVHHVGERPPRDLQALRRVREWMRTRQVFLVLSGGPGTGKTGAAAWLLGQVDRGRFVEATGLIGLALEHADQWHRVKTAPMVVLDDLGIERPDGKGVFAGALAELVNGVYTGDNRRMVVTCNLTPEQFRENYGARMYDRLRESCTWAQVSGESVRGEVAHWQDKGSDDAY